MDEFDVKHNFGLRAILYEKLRKEFRSTPEMPKLKAIGIETKTNLKGEKAKPKGFHWLQQ